jgi:hypothetical protein
MGVFIYLNMDRDRIDPQDWKAVYRETLKLINAYPFLSRVRGEDGLIYAKRTEHMERMEDWDEDVAGWCIDGR